jgi:hypothetical protein
VLERAGQKHLELLGVLRLFPQPIAPPASEDFGEIAPEVYLRLFIDVEHEGDNDGRGEENETLVENKFLEALTNIVRLFKVLKVQVENERERVVFFVDVLRAEISPNENRKRNSSEASRYEEIGFDGVEKRNHVRGQNPNGLVENPKNNNANQQHNDAIGQVNQQTAEKIHYNDQHARHLHPEQHNAVGDRDVPDDFFLADFRDTSSCKSGRGGSRSRDFWSGCKSA